MTTAWNFLDKSEFQCPDGNATIYGKTGSSTNPTSSLVSVCLKCGDKEMGCVNSGYTGGEDYTYSNLKDAKYYNFPSTSKGYGKLVRFMDAGRADDTIVENNSQLGSVIKNEHCEDGVNGFYVERFQNPADLTNIDLANFKPLCFTSSAVKDPVSPSTNSNVEEASDNTVLVMILFVIFIIILGYVLYFIKMYRNINSAVQYAQPIMQ
jgi:hypothetical protein